MLVQVKVEDVGFGIFDGMHFQEELEKKAKESFNNKLQKDVCYCTYNEEKI